MAILGYSGKTLAQKLGVRPGDTVLAIHAPDHYGDLLEPLPTGALILGAAEQPAIVQAFVRDVENLTALGPGLVSPPAPGGSVWISGPKKSSPFFRDPTENGVRRIMPPTGWVDVKVCAVDADWSGLKFLKRRA